MSTQPSAAYVRFLASMEPEGHADGRGYDLEALAGATAAERLRTEQTLMARGDLSWRDVQALGAIGSSAALARLRHEAEVGTPHARLESAVQLHARQDFAGLDEVLEDSLGLGLRDDALLARALDAIGRFKRTRLVHPLLRVVLHGRGESAALCAAMACFLRGKAQAGFDWSMRPFFLRFNTKDKGSRRLAFAELCGRLGEDPIPYLSLSSQMGVAPDAKREA